MSEDQQASGALSVPTSTTSPHKRIILCSDGTGNKGGTGRDTNVWRLYNHIDLSCRSTPHQVAFYDDGIGTQDFKLLKTLGGAFGIGLTRNIRQLYEALVRNYQPGDEIYIFGFSRGAYTARVLAALICKCGIVQMQPGMTDKQVDSLIREAMRHMRDSFDLPIFTGWLRIIYALIMNKHKDVTSFRQQVTHDGEHDPHGVHKLVKFIGVWDTVSAIGTPVFGLTTLINTFFYRIEFPDRAVHHRIDQARHAIALDDERATFHPMLWDESLTAENVKRRNEDSPDEQQIQGPDIQQIWFPGVHSNVGGGYPKQGLAYASLAWIMRHSGLDYRDGALAGVRANINPADKLYDSRSGAAAYYRYKPRDVEKYAKENTDSRVLVDTTAIERLLRSVDAYAPGNLPFNAQIIDSAGSRPEIVANPLAQATSVATALNVDAASMYKGQFKYVVGRQILHSLFLLTTLLIALSLYLPAELRKFLDQLGISGSSAAIAEPGSFISSLAMLVPDALSQHTATLYAFFMTYPQVFYGLLVWILLLYGLRSWLHKRTKGVYRRFWALMRDAWLGR